MDRRVEHHGHLQIGVRLDQIVADARLEPVDPRLVGQRRDGPAAHDLGHLAGGPLPRAQRREERE